MESFALARRRGAFRSHFRGNLPRILYDLRYGQASDWFHRLRHHQFWVTCRPEKSGSGLASRPLRHLQDLQTTSILFNRYLDAIHRIPFPQAAITLARMFLIRGRYTQLTFGESSCGIPITATYKLLPSPCIARQASTQAIPSKTSSRSHMISSLNRLIKPSTIRAMATAPSNARVPSMMPSTRSLSTSPLRTRASTISAAVQETQRRSFSMRSRARPSREWTQVTT
jgi:hypothetical protein